jgi:hypothetical protein
VGWYALESVMVCDSKVGGTNLYLGNKLKAIQYQIIGDAHLNVAAYYYCIEFEQMSHVDFEKLIIRRHCNTFNPVFTIA